MQKKPHNSTRRSVSSRRHKRRKKSDKPRIEVSAGGLVFKKTRRGLYFAMLKDSFGKWTFPKGHVRRGESYAEGAEREIEEEMGLKNLEKRENLGHIDIWFRDRYVFKGRLIHKYIHYFLFESKPEARLFKPKPKRTGERIHAVVWVPISEVKKRSSYKDMKPIIDRAFAILEKKN